MDVADLAHCTYKVLENIYLYNQSVHLLDQDLKNPLCLLIKLLCLDQAICLGLSEFCFGYHFKIMSFISKLRVPHDCLMIWAESNFNLVGFCFVLIF